MFVQQTMAILAIEIQCRHIKLQNNKNNCVCMRVHVRVCVGFPPTTLINSIQQEHACKILLIR